MARDYYDESKPKKKKKETPKPQKVTKSPSVTKVNNRTSNSTFLGGGADVKKAEKRTSAPTRVQKPSERVQRTPTRSTTPQRATDTGTGSRSTRTSRLTAAQTQKTYGTTRPNLKTAEEMRKEREAQRKEREDRRLAAQRQKSGLNDQPTAAQKAATDRALKNTLPIAKESAKGAAYGHLTTLNDIASVKYQGKGKSRDEIYDPNLVEKSRKQSEERVKKYQAKTQETEDAIQKLTKNAKGLEKAYYGAVESGTGMLTDIGVGALTGTGQVGSLAAMFSRTYGSTRGKAQQEGATEAEDRAYAAAQAAKEVGTELMFPGAGLARGYAGKQGLKLADTAANILTKNLRGKAADIGGAGVRLLGGVLEENAEEFAGWGLDPLIKEITYGKKARTRNAQQAMKERSNALRAEIQNEDDARAAAAYLSSDDFFEQTVNAYREAGLSKKDAEEVADRMRDYLTASLTGDTDSMEQIEDEVSKKVAGSKKLEWDFDELKDTIASTTLLTAATGLPGTGMTALKGAALRDQLGDDGVRALANTAIDFEDSEMSLKAKAMKARLDSGNELTSTQVYDLQVGMQEQIRKDTQREESSRRMADKRIKSDNLLTPYRKNENGGIDLDEATEASYREHVSRANEIIDGLTSETKESLTANEKVDGSKAIAGFQTGVFTIEDANTLNYSNTTVRAAFEEATGVDLGQYVVKNKDGSVNIPATNTKTKDALFAMAADNLVKSAQAETANWMDNTKGQVVTQVSARMGASGSAVLQQALDDVDERDRSKYMMTANATDMLYQAARNMGTEWESIAPEATKMFPGISESKLKMMYEAGLADREMANDKARGRQVRMGEALSEMGEQETATGKVFIDTEVPVKGSVIRTFTEIAKNLGADIHFVDYIYDSENNPIAGANGSYDPNTNTFYLNVATGAETNIGYIFMHETTHYLKTYAPEQYQALENLVREKWFAFNPSQMQDAIARKIEAYKRATKGQQVLTEEQALEEIIADASHDFINDPEFAKQVAEEDMGLAKAVLDSIRNALRMLRRIFASGSIDDDTHMNTLFRELDIMAEAEKLWLDAYKVAVQNSAINAVNSWQDDVNKASSTRGTVLYDEANIDDLDMTNKTVEDSDGNPIAQFQDNGDVSFSISSYEDKGRDTYIKYLNKMVKSKELSQEEADDMLRELDTIYNISKRYADSGIYAPFSAWSSANVVYNEKGKPVFSAIKKNSEYKMNIDFSTICKKRRTLDAVFREMINRGMFEKLDLNKDESAAMVVNINNLIRQHKFEAACALCFVEARRYRQQQTATTFTNMWNELVESMYEDKSKIAYFNFGEDSTVEDVPDGIHTMDAKALDLSYIKSVANATNENGKKLQTAEAKAARLILKDPSQRKLMRVGDMMASTGFENMQIQNPKLMKIYNAKKGTGGAKSSFGDVQYLNEIIKSKTFDRRKAYAVSGVRIQSFSDYVPRMVFDYVQVIADLAAKKLPAHAYTKEKLFAYQFGLTGAKINLSLVPDVVDGGVAPGLDAKGNYVWNKEGTFPYEEAMALQKAEGYKDNCGTIAVGISDEQIRKMLADSTIQMVIPYHKSSLNPIVAAMTNVDRFKDYTDFQNTKDADGKTVSKDFDWDNKLFELTHDKEGKQLPKEQWGNVQNLVKEYADWCKERNYTPKFSDFLYMKDGSINPGYYKLLEDFALLDNDGNFKPQGDVQMRFPTESDAFGSMASLIEQGLTEDTELEAKREREIGSIVDEIDEMFNAGTLTEQSATSEKLAQRLSITPEMDDAYMDAVNSGNMEEAQRLVDEAARDSGMRVAHRFHGTMNYGFTVFSKLKAQVGGNSGAGFYFSTNEDDSGSHYSDSEGADNYFKIKAFADELMEFHNEWNGTPIDSDETAMEIARQELINNPGVYDVYLNYKKPYVRNYKRSTNIYDDIIDNFDESLIDREDYDSEEDYEDDRWQYMDEHLYESIDTAVRRAYDSLEENYDIVESPFVGDVVDAIVNKAVDGSLTWDDIVDAVGWDYPVLLEREDWFSSDPADGTPEFVRAIIEEFGYDAIEDKEVDTKFGQLSRDMMKGTEHTIVFRPEQIKLSDPVTYAEDGSVIPLSERFDPTNNDIRYSLPTTDANGKVLTDGQMEYFKNSQARDSQGKLICFYHGTPNFGFTIFDGTGFRDHDGWFFTDRKDAAESYAYGDQSGTYAVYLNLENPLVIDAEGQDWTDIQAYKSLEARDRAKEIDARLDEIRDAWRNGTDNGEYDRLLDELDELESEASSGDTDSWVALAKEEGHDGLIIKNLIDYGASYEGEEYEPFTEAIAFSSNQIKDINNENPTENPDIRYSIPDDTEVKDYISATAESINDVPLADNLLEENRVRYSVDHEDFIRSVIDKFNEGSLTFGLYLDEKSVKKNLIALMSRVMNESGVNKKYRSETLQDTINSAKVMFYEMKANQLDNAAETAWRAAERIVDDIDYNDDLYVQYKGFRDYLSKRKIQIPEGLEYDSSFIDFVRDNNGRMRFSTKGSSVNAVYKYLSKNYPQLLPSDIEDPIDMLLQIDYALEYTAPYREAYTSEEYTKLVTDIAGRLMDVVAEGEAYRTVADKLTDEYEGRIKAMKIRHEEALRRVKETEAEKRESTRQVWANIAKRWKDKYNERVQKDKAERKEKADRREHIKHFGHIAENYNKLCTWVLNPTKEKNVPEEFRKSLADFLQALDLQTENNKKLEAKTGRVAQKTLKMRELKDRLNDLSARKGDDGTSIWEVDESIAFLLEKLSNKLDENGNTIDALDNDDIATIDEFMKLLIRNIERYKQVKTETKMAELSDIGGRAITFLREKIERDGMFKKKGAIQTINATALTPAYLFDRLGALKEMYDVLRHNGFDTYIRNEKMIMDRMGEILSGYYKTNKKGELLPGSEAEKWRDDRSAQTIELENGKSITMTAAQMMSLYCLTKRGMQAIGHMCVGGVVVTPIQTGSKIQAAKDRIKDRGTEESTEKRVLTINDIRNIISKLTENQIKVADQLQSLMSNEMAELGNEAHRELYGYEMFNEDNYFPIKVYGNERSTDINTIGDVIEKIKSFGFTKPLTPNANKALEIDDIFTVVADHCNGMNLYNAYLVPITDFMKVLNYTHTFEDGTVLTMKEAIEQAYGKDMLKYILNLMKDINGIKGENRGGLEGIMNKALGRAKRTAVFGNVRVALQQPTAIVRAAAEINPKYIKGAMHLDSAKGFIPTVETKTMQEMWKYCPIAQWKAWGYYDTYMGRDIEDVMMNKWSIGDKLLSGYYGQLDNATWSMIWQAVKAEQRDAHPDMDHNSEEFLQICGRRASEVFDKTQVVDSTFHRSDAMRNKQIAVKLFTAFMAEPTLTMNVFRAGLFNANEASKAGNKGEAAKIRARAISVIVVQAVVLSAAQAFADAWRGKDPGLPWDDDDDEEKIGYWWRWIHNFVYNCFDQAHLENNMYLVKDVTPYINYMISQAADYWNAPEWLRALMGWDQDYLYSQNNLVFAGLENTATGVAQLFKKLEKGDEYVDYKTKEPKKWYDIIQKIASGIGTFTGLPVGTLMRDFKPFIEKFLPAVYAADTELMDSIAKKIGYQKKGEASNKTSSSTKDSADKDKKSSAESSEVVSDNDALKAIEEKAEKKAAGLSGDELDTVLWDTVMEGYTKKLDAGDMDYIEHLELIYMNNGGDLEKFHAKLKDSIDSAYKKTLKDDMSKEDINNQWRMRMKMQSLGYTDQEISDICYHSAKARDLKAAMRIGVREYIDDELSVLVQAGLTKEDYEKLYKYRNYGAKSYDGKYTDPKYTKTTGRFIWPTNGQITSYFGYRNAPTRGASSNHPAIDIGAPMGADVVASDGGVVIYVGWNGGYGNSVGIKHDNGMVTYYNHLSGWNVKEGDTVAQGQPIANVGSTGVSTGPHLDFKVLDANGKPVDPLKYLASRS